MKNSFIFLSLLLAAVFFFAHPSFADSCLAPNSTYQYGAVNITSGDYNCGYYYDKSRVPNGSPYFGQMYVGDFPFYNTYDSCDDPDLNYAEDKCVCTGDGAYCAKCKDGTSKVNLCLDKSNSCCCACTDGQCGASNTKICVNCQWQPSACSVLNQCSADKLQRCTGCEWAPRECSVAGVCKSGVSGRMCNGCAYVNVSGVAEVCNGADDDCDGSRDEGFQCINGSLNGDQTMFCNNSCVWEKVKLPPQATQRASPYTTSIVSTASSLTINIVGECTANKTTIASSNGCVWSVALRDSLGNPNNCSIQNSVSTPQNGGVVYLTSAQIVCSNVNGRTFDLNLRAVDAEGLVTTTTTQVSITSIVCDPNAQFLNIHNTVPTIPQLSAFSDRNALSGSMKVVAGPVIDPDVFTNGQVIKYSGSVYHAGSVPVLAVSYTTANFFIKSDVNRALDNCIMVSVFDGVADVNSAESYCLPVIDNISIWNSTPSGALQGTKYVKNHFGSGGDSYEQLSCSFAAHDFDNAQINYSIKLFAKRPGLPAVVAGQSSGTMLSGATIISPFTISNYPGTSHTYPIGTRFYCSAEIDDSFFNDVYSSASLSTWTPRGAWEGDTSPPSGFIEVVNTIPYKAFVALIDRDALSRTIFTQVAAGEDPDVFATAEGGQALSYFARIFEQRFSPLPASYGTNLVKGDFNSTDSSRIYTQALTMERDYCSEGRVFDGIEYSPVSEKRCSSETPFNPSCSDFVVTVSPPDALCVNNPSGKTSVIAGVSCLRTNEHIDEDWKLAVSGAQVKDAEQFIVPVSSFLGLSDCNTDIQPTRVVYDSNSPGIYSIAYAYGGVYNGVALSCSKQIEVTTNGCDTNDPIIYEDNSGSCQSLGFLVSDLNVSPKVGNKTDVSFRAFCAKQTVINDVSLKKNSIVVPKSSQSPIVPINCPMGAMVSVSSTFDSNSAGSYDLFIDFNSSMCRAVASYNIFFAGVNLSFPEPQKSTIPDTSPVLAVVMALIAVMVISIRGKK